MFRFRKPEDHSPVYAHLVNLLYGNLRDYKLNIYNYEEKMNNQKRGPVVIDMNIHPSSAIKIEDKKSTRPGFELAYDSFKVIKCSCSAD